MATVLHLGLGEFETPVRSVVAETSDDKFIYLSDLESANLNTTDVVIIGPAVEMPISTIQKIVVADNLISILLIATQEHYKYLKQAILFAPYIGNNVRCLLFDEEFELAYKSAVLQTRQRRNFKKLNLDSHVIRQASQPITTPLEVLGTFLNQAPIGALLLDVSNRIVAANAVAAGIFKLKHIGQLNLHLSDLFSSNVVNTVRQFISAEIHERDLEILNNENQYLELSCAEVHNGQSETLHILLVNDITARKLEEQRKNDFLSIASHELKTPLTSLKGYVQLLMQDPQVKTVPTYKFLEKAEGLVEKIVRLVGDLLDLTKIESGKLIMQPNHFNVNDLISEIIEDTRLTNPGVQIEFFPSEGGDVVADKDRIGQVIINLVNNAIKYSSPGKPIAIKVKEKDGFSRVAVSDSGIGIDKIHHDKIFKRFYRVEEHQSKMVSGFGIGLYICSQIIEKHGGRIGLDSQPGEGSTFFFSLPTTSISNTVAISK